MNSDSFVVEHEDILLAQEVCNSIDDNIRNRAVANVAASNIAKRYFYNLNVDTDSGIHNVPQILKNIDISDIYINGNYIDVRLYFNNNELGVPKVHYDLDIRPIAYMFIKLNEDLSQGSVTGFVFPEDVDNNNCVNGYYVVDEDSLKSYYDLELRLTTVEDEDFQIDFEKDVYSFLDGNLKDIRNFYKVLISSKSAREYLKNTAKAHFVFCSISDKMDENDSNAESQSLEINFDESNASLLVNDEIVELDNSEMLEIFEPLDSIEEGLSVIGDQGSLFEEALPDIQETANLSKEELIENSDSDSIITEETPDEGIALDGSYSDAIQIATANQNQNEGNTLHLDVVEEVQEEDLLSNFLDKEASELNESVSTDKNSAIVRHDKSLLKQNYNTQTVPSLDTIEFAEELSAETITEQIIVNSEKSTDRNKTRNYGTDENEQQIQQLFKDNSHGTVNVSKKKSSPVVILGLLVLLGAVGYFGYTQYFGQLPAINSSADSAIKDKDSADVVEKEQTQEDAMPIETVENTNVKGTAEEPSSSTISAIEQNLNASIEVSNLSVNWEVPASYANNATAKRYFMKLGKVLQLNLKAELLLLSSPPITDKIAIELEFNKESGKFTINKVVSSSGVDAVDGVIKDTVNKVLGMGINTNMSVFGNLQGNPVLIIKL